MTLGAVTFAAWLSIGSAGPVALRDTSAASAVAALLAERFDPGPTVDTARPAAASAAEPAPPGETASPPPSSAPSAPSGPVAPAAPLPAVPVRALPEPELVRDKTLRLSGAILLAVPLFGEALWWRNEETEGFHSVRENWFGPETYAGGADKASHVVGGYIFARELSFAFEKYGNSPARSRTLATAMTGLTGMLVEMGDGLSVYGYSWEDVFSDLVGAGFAAGIGAARLDDTLGIRFGYVKTDIPPRCCRATAYGSDYSRELYSFDLKLDGALKRAGVARPGAARFFLLSLTYGTKGYRFSPEDVRQRNAGVDVGVNMVEVLRALGVGETWWGYDFNHGKWSGFGTGGKFDPGRVIYR
jgi:hypothetical protein